YRKPNRRFQLGEESCLLHRSTTVALGDLERVPAIHGCDDQRDYGCADSHDHGRDLSNVTSGHTILRLCSGCLADSGSFRLDPAHDTGLHPPEHHGASPAETAPRDPMSDPPANFSSQWQAEEARMSEVPAAVSRLGEDDS